MTMSRPSRGHNQEERESASGGERVGYLADLVLGRLGLDDLVLSRQALADLGLGCFPFLVIFSSFPISSWIRFCTLSIYLFLVTLI